MNLREQLEALANIANSFVHGGDYGWMYFHPETGVVTWTYGDGDIGTSEWAMEEALATLPFVNGVVFINECDPGCDPEGDEWVEVQHQASTDPGFDLDSPPEVVDAAEAQWAHLSDEDELRWKNADGRHRINWAWARPDLPPEIQTFIRDLDIEANGKAH